MPTILAAIISEWWEKIPRRGKLTALIVTAAAVYVVNALWEW